MTGESCVRHLAAERLSPRYAGRLFSVRELPRAVAADALRDVYFQHGGRRGGSLGEVRPAGVGHIAFELQAGPCGHQRSHGCAAYWLAAGPVPGMRSPGLATVV